MLFDRGKYKTAIFHVASTSSRTEKSRFCAHWSLPEGRYVGLKKLGGVYVFFQKTQVPWYGCIDVLRYIMHNQQKFISEASNMCNALRVRALAGVTIVVAIPGQGCSRKCVPVLEEDSYTALPSNTRCALVTSYNIATGIIGRVKCIFTLTHTENGPQLSDVIII